MERLLTGAPVGVPEQFSRRNENAFRQHVDGELAETYRKTSDLIVPYGYQLGFNGATGKQVIFGLDGADVFSITVDGASVLTISSSGDLSALEASLTAAYESADVNLGAGLTVAYSAADDALEASLTAFVGVQTDDLYATVTSEYTASINAVDGKLNASYSLTVDGNGRIASLKLLSNGTTSDVIFTADTFQFFDGVTDFALFAAAAGVVTINGDLAVSGSIRIGAVRWPVALQVATFNKADGASIEWASGAALSAVPEYAISVPAGVALAAGEAWEPPTIQAATTTGGTLRLKISTPGATSSVTDTTDSAGGGGDPDRIMHKADSADAYNGVYNFRIQGTISILSENNGDGTFYHDGEVQISPWFDDGGGWDEGPTIRISVVDALGFDTSGGSLTGSQSFDVTKAVSWANAIGQHGGEEYGVSLETGGTITDFVSVQYTKQAVSGTRTGSPNGETATILVLPQNV